MNHQTILFETRGPVGLLTLNRPDRLNAISQQMIDEVNDVPTPSRSGRERPRPRLHRGGPRLLRGVRPQGRRRPGLGHGRERAPILKKDFDFIMRFWHFAPLPTVAAVKGYALAGACEVAMA